jgi:hypothetical protein
MCYFDHHLWPCGYWRWGPFREQCHKEYRTGETCGLKLIYDTYLQPGVCKHCEAIGKKERRVGKMLDDVQRWTREGNRRATIEKTELEIGALQAQIGELVREHEARRVACSY